VNPLRAFALFWSPESGWDVSVHRDLESLVGCCVQRDLFPDTSGVIHIGFSRPDSEALRKIIETYPGLIFVTSSAKFALPHSINIGLKPVGAVSDLELFPVFSGLGYETTPQEWGMAANLPLIREGHAVMGNVPGISMDLESIHLADWMLKLRHEHPALFQYALQSGITDDETLFNLGLQIAPQERSNLQAFRFYSITGQFPSTDNVLNYINLADPHFLQKPIFDFELSVRATNIFTNNNISCFKDIAALQAGELAKLKNMGKKTMSELSNLVFEQWFFKLPNSSDQNNQNFDSFQSCPSSPSIEDSADPNSQFREKRLMEWIEESINSLPARRSDVVKARIGMDGPPMILEEIGRVYGVTRERVRQIHESALMILRRMSIWESAVIPSLDALLNDRHIPLPLYGLEAVDPWFAGTSQKPTVFNWMLEEFCEDKFHLIHFENQIFVSAISQEAWDNTLETAYSLMESQVGFQITQSQAHDLVTGLLIAEGKELREILWEATCKEIHFTSGEQGESILVNVGNGWRPVLESILRDSPAPMHMSEILVQVQKRTGKSNENHIRKMLLEIGLLFERGTYGLRHHLPLTDEEIEELQAASEAIVLNAESQKQWHCAEIYDCLLDSGLDFYDKINPYFVLYALKRSSTISYLGRMIVIAKDSETKNNTYRINIHQALVSLLEAEGKPLLAKVLREKLVAERGLPRFFQILAEDPIVRIGTALWGLYPRDISYTLSEQSRIVDATIFAINTRGKGIHTSRIIEAISEIIPEIVLDVDPAVISTLAQRSGRVRTDVNQYLFFQEWDDCRWPSLMDVVREAISVDPNEGWILRSMVTIAEERLERPLEVNAIYKAFESLGGRYDLDSKKWYFPFLTEPQEEDDCPVS
jgi:hypothetical protein